MDLDILWAVLALAGIAIVLSVLLVWFSIIFHVEEDPRIDEVAKLLPNVNCGACGKAGCRDLAEALVTGEIKKVSACKAGKKDKNFDPIIAYLKATPGPDGTTVDVTL
ncbi:MAG: (Fe-S)-binding protein [Candidatus Enteromonas sp.]|nr:(Fe-S)-binding protein [Candidatus Enteromonas sp.]